MVTTVLNCYPLESFGNIKFSFVIQSTYLITKNENFGGTGKDIMKAFKKNIKI